MNLIAFVQIDEAKNNRKSSSENLYFYLNFIPMAATKKGALNNVMFVSQSALLRHYYHRCYKAILR